eukprot:TRINITY_DN65752_c1_g1_i1.p1 TRINITY_DN65752_c1_g1~~TRINITY_DN65752_c1_g1_i1.p1  ORF type:complete len:106 (-),score=1.75 TRINITY_DN65752_c1_g1_i1:124-402(-)
MKKILALAAIIMLMSVAYADDEEHKCGFFNLMSCTNTVLEATKGCDITHFHDAFDCITKHIEKLRHPECTSCICYAVPSICDGITPKKLRLQ